jgi:hypothetical protein
MKTLFIDVGSKSDGMKIFHRLKRLKSTISIEKPVNYVFGTVQNECIILLQTTWTEKTLDDWLYKSKGIDYIGCGEK